MKIWIISFILISCAITSILGAECSNTNCPCYQCTYNKYGNYWQDCGSTNSWGIQPTGTPIIVYDPYKSTCTPCNAQSGRLLGRVTTTDYWGFVYSGDIQNCQPADALSVNATLQEIVIQNEESPSPKCPSPGTYQMQQQGYLRNEQLFDCGLLIPGQDTFTVQFTTKDCFWCHGQAEGTVCNDISNYCPNCMGLVECSKL